MSSATALLLPPQELERLFGDLVSQWHRETDLLSNSTKASMHPSYQRIIGLGPQVIPLILRELRDHGGHWAWALRAISGENPVPEEAAGNVRAMRDAWIKWGLEKGHLRDN